MTTAEHDDRRSAGRRRKKAIAGAVGLAAVLGGGAFLITDRMSGDTKPVSDAGAAQVAIAPAPPAVSGTPSAPAGSAPASSAATRSAPPKKAPATVAAAPPAEPKTVKERIATARAANKKAGTEVRRPLAPVNGNVPSAVTVTETGNLKKDRETLRVVSAPEDLTGQRELAWAGDAGEPVGDARCTQNIRLSAGSPVSYKPNLLLCWRTSAEKSVYTINVQIDGKPSKDRSVAAIDRQWAKMG